MNILSISLKADSDSNASEGVHRIYDENELEKIAYSKKINLTSDELKYLSNGEMSNAQYIIGGIIGTYPIGLGLGHAIQGRYATEGWIFTVGELTSAAAFTIGFSECITNSFERLFTYSSGKCSGNTLMTLGFVGYVGFKVWEIVSLWAGGYTQRTQYKLLKERILGTSFDQVTFDFKPMIAPQKTGAMISINF